MNDFKLPDDTEFDFSEWFWDGILDEVKSAIPDVESAVLETLKREFPAMLHVENGKLIIAAGLPFITPGDWAWATIDFEDVAAELVDPRCSDPDERKIAAQILRKWADKLDAV